jgi:hypothetical protein
MLVYCQMTAGPLSTRTLKHHETQGDLVILAPLPVGPTIIIISLSGSAPVQHTFVL